MLSNKKKSLADVNESVMFFDMDDDQSPYTNGDLSVAKDEFVDDNDDNNDLHASEDYTIEEKPGREILQKRNSENPYPASCPSTLSAKSFFQEYHKQASTRERHTPEIKRKLCEQGYDVLAIRSQSVKNN